MSKDGQVGRLCIRVAPDALTMTSQITNQGNHTMTHILSNRAMLVSLNVSLWRARKLDHKVTAEVNTLKHAASDACSVSKALIAKDSLANIRTVVQNARAFHYENTLPWDNVGWRILPSANYQTWTDKMRDLKQAFDVEVANFIRDYPNFVTDAKISLNGMFDQDDYPNANALPSWFEFETNAQPIPDGSHFVLDLSAKEIAKQAAKLDERIKTATDAAVGDLWKRLHDSVSHMAERLSTYRVDAKTGKVQGKFHDSMVGNIKELCDLLPRLNVSDDPNLEAMRKKIENTLTKITPQDLRADANARNKIAAAAESIADQMGPFMNA
jgi:hypothetical protein